MWNIKDLFYGPSEEAESKLMSVWRERIRGVVKKCGLDGVLSLTPKQYADELIGAGASEQEAHFLAKWLSEVLSGGTTGPS